MIKRLLLFLLPIILLSNCKKDDNFLFEIPYQAQFTIPAGLNIFGSHIFEIRMIPSRLDSLLAFNNVDPADIKSINGRSARISAVFSNIPYNFVREAYIEVFDANDPDRVWKEGFYRQQVPLNNGSDLDLIASLADLQTFLLEDSFNIRVRLKLREISPEFIESRLDFSLIVR